MPPHPALRPQRIRRRVLARLLNHPPTLLLVAGGATALLAQWALGTAGVLLPAAGAFALLAALGLALSRLVLATPQLARQAAAIEEEVVRNEQAKALEDLRQRLLADGDARSQQIFDDLQQAHQRIEARQNRSRAAALQTVLSSMDELYHAGMRALEQNLAIAAEIDACGLVAERQRLLHGRDRLLQELAVSVGHLHKRLADLPEVVGVQTGTADLAGLRARIDADLEQAHRVEDRLKELDHATRLAIAPAGEPAAAAPAAQAAEDQRLRALAASLDRLDAQLDRPAAAAAVGAQQGAGRELMSDADFDRFIGAETPSPKS